MKKYLKMIPVMIYPYAYIPFLILIFNINISEDDLYAAIFICTIVFNALALTMAILNSIFSAKGKYEVTESSKIVMITKCIQIPAYIFHFIVGCLGILMSVWGIGFILWAIFIDLSTILLTGIASIGNNILLRKKEYFTSNGACVAFTIGHFIYVVDVILCVVNFIRAEAKR